MASGTDTAVIITLWDACSTLAGIHLRDITDMFGTVVSKPILTTTSSLNCKIARIRSYRDSERRELEGGREGQNKDLGGIGAVVREIILI